MIHTIKIRPRFFEDTTSGAKPFEVRNNDRDFRKCDYVALNEYEPNEDIPERERYSGRSALFKITYVLDNPEYCKSGYVILGLAPCSIKDIGDDCPENQTSVICGQTRGGAADEA